MTQIKYKKTKKNKKQSGGVKPPPTPTPTQPKTPKTPKTKPQSAPPSSSGPSPPKTRWNPFAKKPISPPTLNSLTERLARAQQKQTKYASKFEQSDAQVKKTRQKGEVPSLLRLAGRAHYRDKSSNYSKKSNGLTQQISEMKQTQNPPSGVSSAPPKSSAALLSQLGKLQPQPQSQYMTVGPSGPSDPSGYMTIAP
jgi:hypothetical protein